jgi:hypothetical protein
MCDEDDGDDGDNDDDGDDGGDGDDDDDDDDDGFVVDETWITNRSLSLLFAMFFNCTGTGSRLFALLSHVWLI